MMKSSWKIVSHGGLESFKVLRALLELEAGLGFQNLFRKRDLLISQSVLNRVNISIKPALIVLNLSFQKQLIKSV